MTLLCTLLTITVLGSTGDRNFTKTDVCSEGVSVENSHAATSKLLLNISDDLEPFLNKGNNEENGKIRQIVTILGTIGTSKLLGYIDENEMVENLDLIVSIKKDKIIQIDYFDPTMTSCNEKIRRRKRSPQKGKNYISGLKKKSDKSKDSPSQPDKSKEKNKKDEKKPDEKKEEEDLSKRIIGGTSALQYLPITSKFREKDPDKDNLNLMDDEN